jgi:hypothetical protein
MFQLDIHPWSPYMFKSGCSHFPLQFEVLLNLFVHLPMFSLSSIYLFCLHTLLKEVKNVGSLQGTSGWFPCLPTPTIYCQIGHEENEFFVIPIW